MRKNHLCFIAVSVFGCFTTFATGHDLPSSATGSAVWAPARLKYMPVDRLPAPRTQTTPIGVQYVLVLPNRWANTQTIHVCFYGGSAQLRTKILDAASTWFRYVNLQIDRSNPNGRDCIAHDQSEVRIGFSEPGDWSYIGNQSLDPQLVNNNLPSMNLSGFDRNPPAEPNFTGYVLHEWGHALGFHHEHQSPAGGCDAEYNWPKVYAFYKTNYNWDQMMVDDNLRTLLADRSAYEWSTFDPQSIMIYGSDPAFLIKGVNSRCYVHDNQRLSTLDIQGAERAYPKTDANIALQIQAATLPLALKGTLTQEQRRALLGQLSAVQKQLKSGN